MKEVLFIFAGSLLILAPTCLYLFAQGVLGDFIYAAFVFNFKYAGGAALSKFSVFFFFILVLGWPCWFAFVGYFLLLKDLQPRLSLLPFEIMLLVLVGFPIEIFLSTLSGRPYVHYVLMFLPYIGILNAFLLYYFSQFVKKLSNPLIKFSLFLVIPIIFVMSFWLNVEFYKRFYAVSNNISEQSELVTYIRTHTRATDYILVWGTEPAIYYFSQRESPTRFFFQTPFLVKDFSTQQTTNEFLADLQQKRPTLIIDANDPTLPSLDPETPDTALQPPQFLAGFIGSIRQYVRDHYQEKYVVGTWVVYLIKQ